MTALLLMVRLRDFTQVKSSNSMGALNRKPLGRKMCRCFDMARFKTIYTCVSIDACVRMYIMYVRMYLYIMCIYIYIYMYTYIYIYV